MCFVMQSREAFSVIAEMISSGMVPNVAFKIGS
ncbi:hypothetical protein FJ366_01745 [Candidatus Dependentiae bacterium]|nr:hypothetical protein [Candidatus Dependentiae bacterium]